MSTTPQAPATTRPLNGEEYLASLRDGREVWIYGERVEDVTTHPAFRNTARMIARMYDALNDPARNTDLAVPTDTGNGGITHPFFVTPRSTDDLVASMNGIAEWARLSYGWLGRSPDYKASFLGTLGANNAFYEPFDANARNWYREAQEKALFLNHAIVNPPVDRQRAVEQVKDVYAHVDEETDAGLVVSGAKVVATSSALTHANFVANYAPIPDTAKDMSPIFIVPMNARGVRLICRASHELRGATVGSPFDYPLSSRLDENDSILVFDRVLVPWENVFGYSVEKSNEFFVGSGFVWRAMLHGCVRLAVKLDFLSGLLIKGLEATGSIEFRGVQTRVGEVLGWRNTFWALAQAMVRDNIPWIGDARQANPNHAMAYRLLMTIAYPKILEIFQQDLGSALVYAPSHAADWQNPEVRGDLDRYVRGSNGYDAQERTKLMKLIWDAVGGEHGSRHMLYELNYSGNHEDLRLQTLGGQRASGDVDRFKAFVDQCLAEYDLEGWTVPDLVNPGDTSQISRWLPRNGNTP